MDLEKRTERQTARTPSVRMVGRIRGREAKDSPEFSVRRKEARGATLYDGKTVLILSESNEIQAIATETSHEIEVKDQD